MDDRKAYSAGAALCYLAKSAAWRVKEAANGELSYDLEGKLYLSESGYLLLSVPNAIGQGAFDALNVSGAELPSTQNGGRYNAHITVMRPEEIATIKGGGDAISERGHTFTYTTGPVRTFVPEYRTGNWADVSRVWIIEIRSPDLERLRKSYGLSPLPKNNEYRFHVTFAIRRSKILQENEKSKAAASLIHAPEEFRRRSAEAFQARRAESAETAESPVRAKEAGNPYAIQKSGIHGDGIFASRSLEEGFDLGPALIEEGAEAAPTGHPGRKFRRTDIGRYVNHSEKPNAILVQKDDCFHLVTDEPVSAGAEITSNYHDVYDVIGHDATFDRGTAGRDPFLGPPRKPRAAEDADVRDRADAGGAEQEPGLHAARSVGEGAGRSQGAEPAASPSPGVETDVAPFGKRAAQDVPGAGQLQGRPLWLTLIDPAGSSPVAGAAAGDGRLGGHGRPKVADINADIDAAAAECEEPKSKEQAEAGNYRHGHCRLHGMGITIETGKGMTRKGTDKSGKPWSITMAHHYGYIKRTESEADGDHVDVFIGPDAESEVVFVVDQEMDGKFDEHKCMLGFRTKDDAKEGYLACYSPGWKGCGAITSLTMPQFKEWVIDGDTGKPLAGQKLTFKQKAAASALSSLGVEPNPQGQANARRAAANTNTANRDKIGERFSAIQGDRPPCDWLRLILSENSEKRADLLPGVSLQPQQSRVAEPAAHQAVRKLLFHSLGSGKTLASIATAEQAGGPYVASVPAALRPNFKKEQERFTDQTTPNTVQSYNALAKGVPSGPVDTAIFDEAHRLRNPEAMQTQNAKALAAKARNVLLLSGSPIVNRPNDLAPLIEMLTQQPMSPEDFDAKFVGKEKVNPGLGGWLRGVKPVDQTVIKNEDDLRRLLEGHVDYHQPADSGVEQIDERYTVPMSSEQEALHQSFWDQLPWLLRWKLKNQFPLTNEETRSMSSFLAGPRQVGLSTLPFMKGKRDPMKAFRQSPKLMKAMELSREALKDPNAKVVAFSNFIEAGLEPYAAALAAEKVPYAMFHGGLTDAERKQIVDDYNSGKVRQLLLGPSAAEGISLKGTTALQLLDPHWNEARSNQAIGRGIRYDSHTHLPEELRKVRTQRFVSELPTGFLAKMWRRLIQTKPSTSMNDPGTDTYLENMARRKSELNEQFYQLLREVGTQKEAANAYQDGNSAGPGLRPALRDSGLLQDVSAGERARSDDAASDAGDGTVAAAPLSPAGSVGTGTLAPGAGQHSGDVADLGRVGLPAVNRVLEALKRAKALSDRRSYAAKHELLRGLMQESPADWLIDSNANGKFPGITHKPTGFRLHTLRTTIPSAVSA